MLFVAPGEPAPEIPKSKKKEGPESKDPMAKHFTLWRGNNVDGPLSNVIRKETSRTPGKNIILGKTSPVALRQLLTTRSLWVLRLHEAGSAPLL